MSVILGINAYHADSAACVIVDGRLVAAAEEERFRRVKHWAGLPTQAVDYCLREVKLRLTDVDHVAINDQPSANGWRRIPFGVRYLPNARLVWQKIRNVRSRATVLDALKNAYRMDLKAQLHYVEHHLAHLASSFLVSSFTEAACVSLDSFGDFASTAIGCGQGDKVDVFRRIYFPHSLGMFYSALTQWLGFPRFGEEYKVMDLAAYGEPLYLDQMRELVRIQSDGTFRLNVKYFRYRAGEIAYSSWNDCTPSIGLLYGPRLVELLGPARTPNESLEQRHKNIARSIQAMYEKAFFTLLNAVHRRCPSDHLALSGGCAFNALANGKICRRTPFKKIYLPAATGDAGGAIGSAAAVHFKLHEGANDRKLADGDGVQAHPHLPSDNYDLLSRCGLATAYLGPSTTDEELHALLDWKKKELAVANCTVTLFGVEEELLGKVAQAIADGKVIGWFHGRMEWGPRGLGNRSIVADPRRADMKHVLNAKIKRRESFRPFGASILREAVGEWFEQDDDVPFMMQVFQVRPAKRAFIPAVTHVNGSGRLHTVHRETNARYHGLINKFRDISGVPIVLNTSFNENEPIVCYPEEALDCFLRTHMDVLVLGNFCIQRG